MVWPRLPSDDWWAAAAFLLGASRALRRGERYGHSLQPRGGANASPSVKAGLRARRGRREGNGCRAIEDYRDSVRDLPNSPREIEWPTRQSQIMQKMMARGEPASDGFSASGECGQPAFP